MLNRAFGKELRSRPPVIPTHVGPEEEKAKATGRLSEDNQGRYGNAAGETSRHPGAKSLKVFGECFEEGDWLLKRAQAKWWHWAG